MTNPSVPFDMLSQPAPNRNLAREEYEQRKKDLLANVGKQADTSSRRSEADIFLQKFEPLYAAAPNEDLAHKLTFEVAKTAADLSHSRGQYQGGLQHRRELLGIAAAVLSHHAYSLDPVDQLKKFEETIAAAKNLKSGAAYYREGGVERDINVTLADVANDDHARQALLADTPHQKGYTLRQIKTNPGFAAELIGSLTDDLSPANGRFSSGLLARTTAAVLTAVDTFSNYGITRPTALNFADAVSEQSRYYIQANPKSGWVEESARIVADVILAVDPQGHSPLVTSWREDLFPRLVKLKPREAEKLLKSLERTPGAVGVLPLADARKCFDTHVAAHPTCLTPRPTRKTPGAAPG